ncbi:MAG: hypothetical protein Q3987_02290 [Oscillospiraceae bacterium]|nr:hypothetical protein [Oscillospiraceae bacterium]
MKRLVPAAVLLSIALMFTSCSASKDTTPERISGGQTKVAASENKESPDNGKNTAENGFNITYNGVRIYLDEETEPIVKAIGKEYTYTENPSCAYVGIDYTYDYKSFIIYAQEKNGKIVVNTVEVRDDSVDCGGIKIGQTLDDVKKVYGEPSSVEELGIIYIKDGKKLQFVTDGTGKIIFVLYAHATDD